VGAVNAMTTSLREWEKRADEIDPEVVAFIRREAMAAFAVAIDGWTGTPKPPAMILASLYATHPDKIIELVEMFRLAALELAEVLGLEPPAGAS
jgi:hypothetical protein